MSAVGSMIYRVQHDIKGRQPSHMKRNGGKGSEGGEAEAETETEAETEGNGGGDIAHGLGDHSSDEEDGARPVSQPVGGFSFRVTKGCNSRIEFEVA